MCLETLSNSSKSRSKTTALEGVHPRSCQPAPQSPAHNFKHQSCGGGVCERVRDYLRPRIRDPSLHGAITLLLSVSAL